jgi:hypothetical protein
LANLWGAGFYAEFIILLRNWNRLVVEGIWRLRMILEIMKNLSNVPHRKTPEGGRRKKGDLLRWFRAAFRRRSSGNSKYCYGEYWRLG